jgi:hypothetical protein
MHCDVESVLYNKTHWPGYKSTHFLSVVVLRPEGVVPREGYTMFSCSRHTEDQPLTYWHKKDETGTQPPLIPVN